MVSYPFAVLLRLINIFLNAGTGIILARALSIDARGQVAAISSVTGITVVLCTSAAVERILKRQKLMSEYIYPIFATNFWMSIFLVICTFILILKVAKEDAILLCLLSLVLIAIANFNTILNAMIYNKNQMIVNQIFLVSLTIIYCAFLLFYSTNFRLTVLSWITMLTLTNFLISVVFQLYLRRKRVKLIYVTKLPPNPDVIAHANNFEIIAIYSSALTLQILILSLSQILPSMYVAQVAVLMSLVSIIGTPLAPIIPNLLAHPKESLDRIFEMSVKKILFWTICSICSASLLSYVTYLMFPHIYGLQYANLSKAVPYVIFYGLIFTALQYLSTLARGNNKYFISTFLNVGPILFISILVALQTISISQFFLFLGIANLLAVITSYFYLQREQSVKQK